jgi:signal peptidase II
VEELKKDSNGTGPTSGRSFLKHTNFVLPDLTAHLIFWSLAIAGFALDLWTKHAVFQWLENRGYFSVIDGFFTLVRTVNDGAAFGIASGNRILLVSVSLVAMVAIFLIFFLSGTERRLIHVALGLFAAGVCGNFYDRAFNEGLVRDFIDIVYWPGKHWPAFNIADSMLCIAVGLMIISCFTEKPSQKHDQLHK